MVSGATGRRGRSTIGSDRMIGATACRGIAACSHLLGSSGRAILQDLGLCAMTPGATAIMIVDVLAPMRMDMSVIVDMAMAGAAIAGVALPRFGMGLRLV